MMDIQSIIKAVTEMGNILQATGQERVGLKMCDAMENKIPMSLF